MQPECVSTVPNRNLRRRRAVQRLDPRFHGSWLTGFRDARVSCGGIGSMNPAPLQLSAIPPRSPTSGGTLLTSASATTRPEASSTTEGAIRIRVFAKMSRGDGTGLAIMILSCRRKSTGLGRFGHDKLLVDTSRVRDLYDTMHAAFGSRVERLNKQGVAYSVARSQSDMYSDLFPTSDVFFATQEFGTLSPFRVLSALSDENRWTRHGAPTTDHPVKAALLRALPTSEKWRASVVRRGRVVFRQGTGLPFRRAPLGL